MIDVLTLMVVSAFSYLEAYPKESQNAVNFAIEHKREIKELKKYIGARDALLAMCVVAPEVSQYSKITDTAETFALYTLYVQGQVTNFSIGEFQMKPNFAISIENEVSRSVYLSKYKDLIINESTERAMRYERVERLTSLEWQILYLAAFIDIAKKRTENIPFKTIDEKLKYWATLYNAGINTPDYKIYDYFDITGFPKFSLNSFNYGSICVEFYSFEKYCSFLR
jgi:hypothetical protein